MTATEKSEKPKMFKCIECEEEFNAPKWYDEAGHRHVVAPKTYYAAAGELITYVTEEKLITLGDGRTREIPAKKVQFLRGAFTTQDPEEQFGLNAHKGLISAEEWQRRFLTPEDQLHMKNQKMQAQNNRLEEERNTLLEKIKELQQQPAGKRKEAVPA